MQKCINQYILEYFRANDFYKCSEYFQQEIKKYNQNNAHFLKKIEKYQHQSKLQQIFKTSSKSTKKQHALEIQLKNKQKKYKQVLQAGRQIFSISISLLQMLHSLKQSSRNQNISQAIQNYKIQLGKNHKIIINQGKPQGNQLISQNVILQHKGKLQKYFSDKNEEGIIEIFLSLRVNALQIAPQLRKNLVCQLINTDILKIHENQNYDFVMKILENNSKSLRHAITSLISVIVSSIKGVQYISKYSFKLIIKIIKIMKEQDNGSITQRFCLAILQKCSIKQSILTVYLENQLIQWVINLLKRSFLTEIHIFCLDFSSAMMANIIHSKKIQSYLQTKPQFTKYVSHSYQLIDTLLKFIREKMAVSVLMHLLITISYLTNNIFKQQIQEVNLMERINEFIQYYTGIHTEDNEAAEIDKKTVLELCSHMFHPKIDTQQIDDQEKKIIEYQNEQCELIFECFQDQVN